VPQTHSALFISSGVPNGEFPEILIAKCRSRFFNFFVGGRSCGRKRCVREINVSRAWNPVHAGDKALTRETPAKRRRVNRYVFSQNLDNITVNKYAKQIPELYGEVLRSWNKIGGGQTRTPLNFADVRKQIIWGNKFIKFDHKTLLFNNWINNDFYLTLYTFSFEINESSLSDTRCCITTLVIKEWRDVARDAPCRTTLTLRHTIGLWDKTQ
jgi:hypothetical protein